MADLKTLVQDEMDRAGSPSYSYDDLRRRRGRKRRNQRVTAGVVGIGVALLTLTALTGSILIAQHSANEPTPTASPSPQTPPPVPQGIFAHVGGWIAYSDPLVSEGIWAVNPAGPGDPEDQIQLSERAGEPLGWSSDGSKLLIRRRVAEARHDRFIDLDLFILHADGTETRLTTNRDWITGSISPDGSQVVYAGLGGRLYTVDTQGGEPRVLLSVARWAYNPAFSPDGTQIAYFDGWGDNSHSLRVMRANGSGVRILFDQAPADVGHVDKLIWSPDGSRLAFSAEEGGIWIINVDGSGLTKIIPEAVNPSWSPDGSRISYELPPNELGWGTLMIARVDGTHVQEFGYAASGAWNPLPLSVSDDGAAAAFPGQPRSSAPIALLALAGFVLLVRGARKRNQSGSGPHLERSRIAVVLAVSMVATSACGRDASDPNPRPDLERRLEQLPASGAVGVLATEDLISRAASGERESGRPAQPGDRFGIASVTKTFVATVVLQLVDEGLLSLQDTIEDVLPGALPYGNRITVRQLLNHSSGIDDGHLPELSPRKTLDALAKTSLVSRPGSVHSYANANYVLLGVIVEEVTGQPVEQVVGDRVFTPLGLDHTSFGTARTQSFESAPWLGYPDVPSEGQAATGGIVSTADDVAMFFRALLGGELLERGLVAEMTRTIEASGDDRAGLGIFELALSCGTAWGHGGEWPAYSSMALASSDGSRVVVVAQNSGGWTAALVVAEEIYCS